MQDSSGEQWAAILAHKLDSLISECCSYLQMALKAAEAADSERGQLRRKILGDEASLEDTRLALRLIVNHAAGNTRSNLEALLLPEEPAVAKRLHASLRDEAEGWMSSLSAATERFDQWLRSSLAAEMGELSSRRRKEFMAPVHRTGKQLAQALQDFRNRLSENVLETLGVPLRTTEVEMRAEEPKAPDVRVGKIYDRNWELLSWLIPMPLVRGLVKRHFHAKVDRIVPINLSRLVAQWSDAVNGALAALGKDAQRRLADLVATVDKLTAAAGQQAPQIRADLNQLESLRQLVRSRRDEPLE